MAQIRRVGPHPSYIEIRKQFITEEKIQAFSSLPQVNPAKEDSMRLQGVSWIDSVRKALRL
jgi:CTD kinase subunit beta